MILNSSFLNGVSVTSSSYLWNIALFIMQISSIGIFFKYVKKAFWPVKAQKV